MWNDIDLYHAFRDFTTDPVSFPINDVKDFIDELVCLIFSSRIAVFISDSPCSTPITSTLFLSWMLPLPNRSTQVILYVLALEVSLISNPFFGTSTILTRVAWICKLHEYSSRTASDRISLFRGVFVKNPGGSEYVGQVWPGYTVKHIHPVLLHVY